MKYNHTRKLKIFVMMMIVISIFLLSATSTHATIRIFQSDWYCDPWYNGFPIYSSTDAAGKYYVVAVSVSDTAYGVDHVELCNDAQGAYTGCTGLSNPGCYMMINYGGGPQLGYLKNNIGSIRFTHFGTDETTQSCAASGRVWFEKGGAANCCDPGDVIVKGNSLCDSGTYQACSAQTIGALSATKNYACSSTGWMSLTTAADVVGPACGYTVNKDSGNYANIFLAPSQTTDTNRCCGDDVTDKGYITTDDKNVCTYINSNWKWLSSSDAFAIVPTNYSDTVNYDSISNGASWVSCNPDNLFSSIKENVFTATGLTEAPPGDYEYTGESELSSGFSVTTTQTSQEESVSQEDVLLGVTSSSISKETIEQQGNVAFALSPNEIGRLQKLKLKVQIQSALTGFKILNGTLPINQKILVSEDGEFIPAKATKVYHANINSVSDSSTPPQNLIGYGGSPLEITLPTDLSEGLHDLNITILTSGGDIYNKPYILKDAFTITEEVMEYSLDPFLINPKRFLCHKTGGNKGVPVRGSITECCGPNYLYCNNLDLNATRISGGPTSLLKDFYGDPSRNIVKRILFPPLTVTPTLSAYSTYSYSFGNLPITNWSTYDSLEFDIILVGSNKLNITTYDKDNKLIINEEVAKYSLTGPKLGKWHHIRIPLAKQSKSKLIKEVKFIAKGSVLLKDVGTTLTTFNDQPWMMLFAIDRFYLSSSDTKFCATDFIEYKNGVRNVGKWTDDLDSNEDACNNVASYRWTGSRCCGDDQGRFNSQYPDGTETFNDQKGGCWEGLYVGNNSAVPVSLIP